MPLRKLHDRDAIEVWLRRDAPIHLYELGDLDDFYWPHTTWYGLTTDDESDPHAIALLYTATDLPVLLVMGREDRAPAARALLAELRSILPKRFFAHLVPGIASELAAAFRLEDHGRHDRMTLVDRRRVLDVDTTSASVLGPSDLDELLAFYRHSNPANWFDPRMLQTESYFGVRKEGALMTVAGVHVVSSRYRVAALGNVATDPAARRRGLARVATAAVCKALAATADPLGLNVHSANAGAIALYQGLGFERIASYEEVMATAF